jgi:hypothetical protein
MPITPGAVTFPAARLSETPARPVGAEPELIQNERAVVRDLFQIASDRAAAEKAAEQALQSETAAAEKEFREGQRRLDADYHSEKSSLETEFERVCQEIAARHESEHAGIETEFSDTGRELDERFTAEQTKAQNAIQEARWSIASVLDANNHKIEKQYQDFKTKHAGYLQQIEAIRQEAFRLLGKWVLPQSESLGVAGRPGEAEAETLPRLKAAIAAAESALQGSQRLLVMKLVRGKWFIGVVVLFLIVALIPVARGANWQVWLPAGGGAALLLSGLLNVALVAKARQQANRIYHPLCQSLDEAKVLCEQHKEQVTGSYRRQMARIQEKHDADLQLAESKNQRQFEVVNVRHETGLRQAEVKRQKLLAASAQRRTTNSQEAEEKYPRLLANLQEQHEKDSSDIVTRHEGLLAEIQERHTIARQTLAANWQQGLDQVQEKTNAIQDTTRHLFPDWEILARGENVSADLPPVLRFGSFQVSRSQVPQGIPGDPELNACGPVDFDYPTFLTFPEYCSMLFKVGEEGRSQAEQAMQAVMFRLLGALPPGKARFAVIDPIGLGENFAVFMHLADYDEALVSSRIWTEHQAIEQCLADLMAHMEKVIQKYLRNQFQSIVDYNADAGEVAEAFRFLVVANFPANFSPEAARRLVSIVKSGGRCGVHTLISVDTRLALPPGFQLKDLEPAGALLLWKEGRFLWQDPDFSKFPFHPDAPPDAEVATRLLNVLGHQAREANRVEVPFSYIAPVPENWWTSSSRLGIQVPLGRSGATKRQLLQLGKGTAQHVLIAGKTGSGKSTLLHALITNLALMYSPDEVELYLVDFKEGVEFKPYATHDLPHARLVAIESEREFGLSVLQQLDAELKRRGELYRTAGVQDLNGYRQETKQSLPRILLIVDEFQLFFVDDDKIASDSALLLDRLVRQGRAFGIHVLLGSQTLGGAYSLARSTIGQMAVRIALQCSEADAHLILSDDNPAARLLSRPGEAIYNDANGLVEGNDFFQVVWLGDDGREDYLLKIRELAEQRGHQPPQPQIVFEGNAPADVNKNHLLTQLLSMPTWPGSAPAHSAWLGEAMAIKDPTAATFRPQSGSNCIMVGQLEEAALGIITTGLISLIAQYPLPSADGSAPGVKFFVLDGTPVDSPRVGWLAKLAELSPQAVRVVGWRDLASVMGEVAAEVERRQLTPDVVAPDWFLFVHGLQRFRDLKKQEDDYSFSRKSDDQPTPPATLFGNILRDGPPVGVFTLLWCDTLTNVQRALDRQSLREFEMRVLFQMSAADSSNLIDSPLASKLGMHRALFFSEERGQPEKFRPYGLPSPSWLDWVKERLNSKQ